jgi:hypothetical protein
MKMKKIKLALFLGAIFSYSPLLYAENINLQEYIDSSLEEKKLNYTNFLIKFKEGSSVEDLSTYISKDILKIRNLSSGFVSLLLEGQVSKELIEKSGLVESVDITYPIKVKEKDTGFPIDYSNLNKSSFTDDPYLANQKYFNETSEYKGASSIARAIEEKQQNNNGGEILIGVIDAGEIEHNDVIFHSGQNLVDNTRFNIDDGGYDRADGHEAKSINNSSTCYSSHGLQVASILSALQNNTVGGSGIVNAKIVSARAASTDCLTFGTNAYQEDIAESINWLSGKAITGITVIDQPVDIINMSLGGSITCDAATQSAINFAISNDIIVIVSAGNDNANVFDIYPANCNDVIVVANNDNVGNKSASSNYGAGVTLSALGEDVVVAIENSGYKIDGGTSFSAPVVAGVAGLIKEKYVDLINQETVKYLLVEGVTEHSSSFSGDSEDCITDSRCGAGVMNAYNSMTLADQLFGFETEASHFYTDKNSCEGNLYLEKMSNLGVDVCNLYNVNVKELDNFKEVKYQIIKREEQANTWTDNNTVVVEEFSIESNAKEATYKLKEKDSAYEYGIRICDTDNNCFNSQDLNFGSVVSPEFCQD